MESCIYNTVWFSCLVSDTNSTDRDGQEIGAKGIYTPACVFSLSPTTNLCTDKDQYFMLKAAS